MMIPAELIALGLLFWVAAPYAITVGVLRRQEKKAQYQVRAVHDRLHQAIYTDKVPEEELTTTLLAALRTLADDPRAVRLSQLLLFARMGHRDDLAQLPETISSDAPGARACWRELEHEAMVAIDDLMTKRTLAGWTYRAVRAAAALLPSPHDRSGPPSDDEFIISAVRRVTFGGTTGPKAKPKAAAHV